MGNVGPNLIALLLFGLGLIVAALPLLIPDIGWSLFSVGLLIALGSGLALLALYGIFPSSRARTRVMGLFIRMRGFMAEIQGGALFITEKEAVTLISSSAWGRYRYATNGPKLTVADLLAARFMGAESPGEPQGPLFEAWAKTALRKFEGTSSQATKALEGGAKLYNETALKSWLDQKYEEQALEKFGPV